MTGPLRSRSCPACRSLGGPDRGCQDPWHLYDENGDPVPAMPADPRRRQVGGDHYITMSPTPLEVIRGWGLGFLGGNALKYLARAGHKGGAADAVQDLDKAIHYLELLRAEFVERSST